MPVTMRDIAAYCGVSLSTVSRVLNGKGGVAPEKAEAVLKAAESLGYRVTGGQRFTRPGITGNLLFAVFISRPDGESESILNPFYSHVLSGAHSGADRAGYRVIFTNVVRGDQAGSSLSEDLLQQVDAVLLVGWGPESQVLPLLRSRVPVVLVDHVIDLGEGDEVDAVVTDHRGGIRKGVLHLYQRGCRRLAFLGGPSVNTNFRERREAFLTTLQELGLGPWDSRYAVEADPGVDGGYEGMSRLLSGLGDAPLPDGLVCANDELAIGALRRLAEEGVTVPDTVKVIGFDDIDAASLVSPPLTTLRVHKVQMGQLAAEMAIRRIQKRDFPPTRVQLAVDLVVRATT